MSQVKKGNTKHAHLRTTILALLLTAVLACGMLALPASAVPVTPPINKDAVIYNYPYEADGTVEPKNVTWTDSLIHPRGADWSAAYPAPATHVAITDVDVTFYGYFREAYMDFVFSQSPTAKNWGNTFTIVPQNMNFHTLSEAAYLFNGKLVNSGTSTAPIYHYTGYALALRAPSSSSVGTASIYLYYMHNEKFECDNFASQRGGTSPIVGTRTLVHTFVPDSTKGIPAIPVGTSATADQYRLAVNIDPDTREFTVKVDVLDFNGNLLTGAKDGDLTIYDSTLDVTFPLDGGGAPAGTGFGFYTGYFSHACQIISSMKFDVVKVKLFDEAVAVPAKSTVNFLSNYGANPALCAAVSKSGTADGSFVGQQYKVTIPEEINIDGVIWSLVRTSRDTDPNKVGNVIDKLIYQTADADNVTNAYYERETEYKVTEMFVEENTTKLVDAAGYPNKVTSNVSAGAAFSPTAAPPKTIKDFTYVGYRVNGGTLVKGNPPAAGTVLIASVTGDSVITYEYAKAESGGVTILPIPIIAPITPIVPIIPINLNFCKSDCEKPIQKSCKAEPCPKTGDNSMALAALLGLSFAVAGAAALKRKAKK